MRLFSPLQPEDFEGTEYSPSRFSNDFLLLTSTEQAIIATITWRLEEAAALGNAIQAGINVPVSKKLQMSSLLKGIATLGILESRNKNPKTFFQNAVKSLDQKALVELHDRIILAGFSHTRYRKAGLTEYQNGKVVLLHPGIDDLIAVQSKDKEFTVDLGNFLEGIHLAINPGLTHVSPSCVWRHETHDNGRESHQVEKGNWIYIASIKESSLAGVLRRLILDSLFDILS